MTYYTSFLEFVFAVLLWPNSVNATSFDQKKSRRPGMRLFCSKLIAEQVACSNRIWALTLNKDHVTLQQCRTTSVSIYNTLSNLSTYHRVSSCLLLYRVCQKVTPFSTTSIHTDVHAQTHTHTHTHYLLPKYTVVQ